VLSTIVIAEKKSNYSATFLAPPAAALEKEGNFAGTPRAPATRSDWPLLTAPQAVGRRRFAHAGGMSAMTASPGTPY